MRIAIDGFNLGLKQGTGLATYARELSYVLNDAGHDVFPIYGLTNLKNDDELRWPSFIQRLANHGEAGSDDYRKWLARTVLYAPHMLFQTRGVGLTPVELSEHVESAPIGFKLPAFKGIYNCPGVYRASQAYTRFVQRPLRVNIPEAGIDALHLTCPLPISMPGVKTVMTAHDIIPLVLPHSTDMNLKHYRRLMATALGNSDMIFCISEKTRDDLRQWFGIPDSRMHLTYQAVNIPQKYRQLQEAEVSVFLENNFGLDYKGYFLFFGAIEPKKNVSRVIDAMRMARTDLPLVIAGKDGWLYDDVHERLAQAAKLAKAVKKEGEEKSRPEKIQRVEYLPFAQLMYLVKGARALVFPSLYEGFGLPVLEAMQLGCPVITANTTSLREVAGDAALTVDPMDTDAIKTAIERLSVDDGLCQELVEKGYQQAEKFSPGKHAERLAEGYAKAGLRW
ncbi:glycosyltransferase family 4 protein [Thiothrix nivea]|uniref:Glycosyl transferase group 1 n=1 Tax=Thiothrix nivea (strain ATCC 35100 / DSM 5205 / JP2) TaxID=870187 RepID=A0A656HBP7_THINJ|nr:glycosyltransferase family 1 protein [Thiothrix nivea]EIJ34268.1 glycosyl transferase group 1 [Thiothrix nivea DSM 5205]